MTSDWKKEAIRCQLEWAQILHSWKYFDNEDDLVKTYIGICLFGFVECQEIENQSIRTYHLNYNESQRTHIGKIFAHMTSISGHKIELGHTFLYLNENSIVYCVFRFRKKNQIFFIEPSGRFYNSWVHFLETNELPPCEFFAPENGVYSKINKILCYRTSGSKKWFNKSQTLIDWVCAIAGVGCTLLGLFSIAPGVAAGTTIAIGAKSLHKALSNFVDQEEHKQINSLNSVNTAVSLATIAASALSGASKTCEMISLAGEHSMLSLKILQHLNFTSRLIDAGYFGTYLLHLSYVARKGRISNVDALELAAQMFILYGAVVDVKHLQSIINREKKILKNDLSCKFNEWKYKLNKSGVRVKDCHPLIGLKLLANRCKNPLKILSKFYSNDELILNTCYDFEHFTIDFLCDRINLNQYCLEMRPLFVDFSHFFNSCNKELGDVLRYYISPLINDDISENDYKDICKLFIYALSMIKKIEPESVPQYSETVRENCPPYDVFKSETTENYKIIIDVAKSLVHKKNIYMSIEQVVKSCHNSISFTTSKLEHIIVDSYNFIVDFNRRVIGEERLKIMLERVHASTLDEYFHHDEAFKNFISKFKIENSLPEHELVPINPSRLHDYEVEEISERVMKLYELAYASATNSKKLSLQDTMKILQNVSAFCNEKLLSAMNHFCPVEATATCPTSYSELNAQLKRMSFDETCESVNMAKFRQISRNLETDRSIIAEFQLVSNCIPIEKREKTEITDAQLCEALLIVCCNFFNEVVNFFQDNNCEEFSKIFLLRKVFYFVISKFLILVNSNIDTPNSVSREKFDCSKSIFSLYPKSRFYSAIQVFDDAQNLNKLKEEFKNLSFDNNWSYDKIDIWKGIIDSEKFRLLIIRCTKQDCKEFYKSISSELFDINVDHEYDVLINVNSVILKSLKKFIVFSYVNDCDVIVTLLSLRLNI